MRDVNEHFVMPKFLASTIMMLIAAGAILLSAPVSAFPSETSPVDLLVGVKSLALLQNKIEGSAKVAVIYNPSIEASKADAQRIKAFFDENSHIVSNLRFSTVLVPVGSLQAMTDSKIVVLADGLDGDYTTIGAIAAAHNQLTMSADLGCVKANKCVLGIVSEPTVEIYYSQQAADASKIVFADAFTMLVKRI